MTKLFSYSRVKKNIQEEDKNFVTGTRQNDRLPPGGSHPQQHNKI